MAINVVFVGVAVADYAAARAWYSNLWGRAPDMLPNANEAAWQLAGQAWMYVVGDAHRAGKALLTLIVSELDQHIAQLAQRELEPAAIETNPGLYRQAVFNDPAGNTIRFVELISVQRAG